MFQTILALTIHTLSITLILARPVLTHSPPLLSPALLPKQPAIPTQNQLRQSWNLGRIRYRAAGPVLLQTLKNETLSSTLFSAAFAKTMPEASNE